MSEFLIERFDDETMVVDAVTDKLLGQVNRNFLTTDYDVIGRDFSQKLFQPIVLGSTRSLQGAIDLIKLHVASNQKI